MIALGSIIFILIMIILLILLFKTESKIIDQLLNDDEVNNIIMDISNGINELEKKILENRDNLKKQDK